MADYSSIGNQTSRNFTDLYQTAQKNSPDVNKLVNTANDIEFSKKKASMQARHGIQKVGFTEVAKKNTRDMQKKLNEDVKDILAPSQRFAGIVAGLGAVSGGAIMIKNNLEEKKEQELLQSNYDALRQDQRQSDARMESKLDNLLKQQRELINEQFTFPDFVPPTQPAPVGATTTTPAGVTGTSSFTGSSLPLTQVQQVGLKAIRDVESGHLGYNAYNLGGRTEFDPIRPGSAADGRQFGKPLTSMTIGEIKNLGTRGLIHATGAYQFTHNTGSFGEAAQFAGLGDNDLFTPENQDRMALAFGRQYDWTRWSGLKKDAERAKLADAAFR